MLPAGKVEDGFRVQSVSGHFVGDQFLCLRYGLTNGDAHAREYGLSGLGLRGDVGVNGIQRGLGRFSSVQVGLLEEPDARDACGAGGHARSGVFPGYAAESENKFAVAPGATGLGESFETEGGPFVGGREDGAECDEVGFSGLHLLDGVARAADDETGQGFHRGSAGKVDAVGATGERDVGAGVDQDFGMRVDVRFLRARFENGHGEVVQFAGGQIFFADLDEIDTEVHLISNDFE